VLPQLSARRRSTRSKLTKSTGLASAAAIHGGSGSLRVRDCCEEKHIIMDKELS